MKTGGMNMELKPLTKAQINCGRVLLECIARGQYTIDYSDISKLTGVPLRAPGHDVGAAIGELSKHCHELGLPLISVMVVQKATGICGEGFFYLCNELNVHPEYSKNMDAMFKACMNDVRECARWGEFADHMKLKIEGLN